MLLSSNMAATGVLPSRAPAATGHPQSKVTPPTKPLPQSLIDGARVVEKQTFDFNRHCNFQMPSNILTMEDIGYTGMGISNTAVSEPFPLFTEEAIKQMRGEIFSKHVLDNFQCATKMATNMIRGYGSEYVMSFALLLLLRRLIRCCLETLHSSTAPGTTQRSSRHFPKWPALM